MQRLLESNKKLIEKQRGNSTKVRYHSKNQDNFFDAQKSEPHFESEPADPPVDSYMSNNFKLPNEQTPMFERNNANSRTSQEM